MILSFHRLEVLKKLKKTLFTDINTKLHYEIRAGPPPTTQEVDEFIFYCQGQMIILYHESHALVWNKRISILLKNN